MKHKKHGGRQPVAITVYKGGLPAVHGTGETAAVRHSAPRAIARVSKKAQEKLERAEGRIDKLVGEKKAEPVRAALGAAAGNIVGFGGVKLVSRIAKKSPGGMIARHKPASHLVLAALGLVTSVGGVLLKSKTTMHAGSQFMTFNLGAAAAYDEAESAIAAPAPGVKGPEDTSGPFDNTGAQNGVQRSPETAETQTGDPGETGARRDRLERRQRLVKHWANRIRQEDPKSAEGSDTLEEHVGDLLGDIDQQVAGLDDVLSGEETGILPLAALIPSLIQAMPALKKMAKESMASKSKAPASAPAAAPAAPTEEATSGTPGLDALLALEGYDIGNMSTEGKRFDAWRLRRLEKKQRKLERKTLALKTKDLVKSGELVNVLNRINERLDALETRPAPEPALVAPAQAVSVTPVAEESPLVMPSYDETSAILSGAFPAYNLVTLS